MSMVRDRNIVLKWLKTETAKRNIPYVTALEWMITHQIPKLDMTKFNHWMDTYYDRANMLIERRKEKQK